MSDGDQLKRGDLVRFRDPQKAGRVYSVMIQEGMWVWIDGIVETQQPIPRAELVRDVTP